MNTESNKIDADRRNIPLAGTTLALASVLASGPTSATTAETSSLNPQPLPPSPEWARALPPGPDTSVKITEADAAMVARDAYFWAWPMINLFNKRLNFKDVTEPMMIGPGPAAPLNRVAMLTDYIEPEERLVACPNQDVVYGAGSLALDLSPVVIQVPDFGNRFWVPDGRSAHRRFHAAWQDVRHDARLLPAGWTKLARRHSKGHHQGVPLSDQHGLCRTARIQGRHAGRQQGDSERIDADHDVSAGGIRRPNESTDCSKIKKVPAAAAGDAETKWVFPEKFFDQLPAVLADAPPLPGEESRYAQMRALLEAIGNNPALKAPLIKVAPETDEQIVKPLFDFRNWRQQLPHHWSTISNEAAFGTDYFTRTAAAKSNILVNSPNETKYFYQDFDASGARLNSSSRYTVTFAKDGTPPVNGFWSLSIYNEHQFFVANPINRFSVGTKNKDLKLGSDGSLTIHVQPEAPSDPAQRANWLPAPKGDFSLYVRAYWPKAPVIDGSWTPPAVVKVG